MHSFVKMKERGEEGRGRYISEQWYMFAVATKIMAYRKKNSVQIASLPEPMNYMQPN